MAISLVETEGATSNSGAASVAQALTTSSHSPDLILAMWAEGGIQLPGGASVSDNVNTGTYTNIFSYWNNSLTRGLYAWIIKCNATGTATITLSGLTSGQSSGLLMVSHYNGFVHGPAAVGADLTTNSGTGTATSGTGFNNSVTNELLIAMWVAFGASNGTASPANWVAENQNAGFSYWDWLESTSGNSITFSQTQGASSNWAVGLFGIQDLASAPASIAWIT